MAGATSLVQLILKKWGDDIAGAAKELEEKVGFPESVANRIATGELPMDAESIARRADEQGYGDVVYHGSTDPNILEVSAGKFGSRNEDAVNTGMWMSESPYVANGYSGGYSDNGAVYPLRYKSDEPAYINAQGAHWSRLDPDSPVMMNVSNHKIGDMWDPETGEDIPEMWDTLKQERVESTLDEVDPSLEYVDQNLHRDTNNTAEMANDNWNDSAIFFHVKDPGPYSSVDAHTHKDWDMPINKARFEGGSPTDTAINHVVLKPYDIRSPNAAFDPQYTGTNIMGGAALPVAAGLLAAGQSDDSEASVARLAKRGMRLIEDIQDTNQSYERLYTVVDKSDQPISTAHMTNDRFSGDVLGDGQINAMELEVNPPYRGKGIAGEMYDAIEEVSGMTVVPSNHLTPDGAKFWAKRDRGLIEEMLERGDFVEWDNESLVKNALAERGNADPRLLAGTAAGTAGLLAAPALMKDGVFQHGATSEPVVERKEPVRNQSSLLESVTDFGDEVIKSAKHAAGPLSLLVPYEGINDYLKTVNDEDRQPTWMDRLGLLDF